MVQDSLNQALHIIESLLGKCEQGKDSRILAAELGAIMESVEAAHRESVRDSQSEKRASALLENELRRSTKLEMQIAELQHQIAELQNQIDVLTKTERRSVPMPPLVGEEKRRIPSSLT